MTYGALLFTGPLQSLIGFGVTVATSFEHPYAFARRMSTLDHLTEGRVGWNIVTGYLESAARNHGRDTITPHAVRYEMADEFLDVTYKLWEGSWEDGAVGDDPARAAVDPMRRMSSTTLMARSSFLEAAATILGRLTMNSDCVWASDWSSSERATP